MEASGIKIDTEAPSPFITVEEWNKSTKFDGTHQILKWDEVEQDTVFQLSAIQTVENTRFTSHVLHYTNRLGEEFKCFAPTHMIKEILRRRKDNMMPYFVSYGHIMAGSKKIAKFDLTFTEEPNTFVLFI